MSDTCPVKHARPRLAANGPTESHEARGTTTDRHEQPETASGARVAPARMVGTPTVVDDDAHSIRTESVYSLKELLSE